MNNKCPLTGQPCNQHKCIHITDVGPNYSLKNELHLCQECGTSFLDENQQAQPKEEPAPSAEPVVNTFFDLLELIFKQKVKMQQAQQAPQTQHAEPVTDKNACPTCGCTIKNIINSSKLGCPDCYDHFREQLVPVLLHAHKATKHVGKIPNQFKKRPPPENIPGLEAELAKLVSEEKYEEAAIIKEKLKTMKSQS